MVHYTMEGIWASDSPDGGIDFYFSEVKLVDTGQKMLLALYQLDLSSEQKAEIMKEKNLTLENFEQPEGVFFGGSFLKEDVKRLEDIISGPPTKGNHSSLVDDLGLNEI